MTEVITIKGADKLAAMLKRKKQAIPKVRQVVKKHGANLQNTTQQNMRAAYIHGYSTGATARSTTLKITDSGLSAVVQPHTKYFPYLEHGTRKMSALPTLHPAFAAESQPFINDVKGAIRNS